MSLRHLARTITVIVVVMTAASVGVTTPVDALVYSPFVRTYHARINGDIAYAQNSALTCNGIRDTGANDPAGCANAQAALGTLTNNNDWKLVFVDIDGDPSTFNSSRSQLDIPTGSTVERAILYWGAQRTGTSGQPSINTPVDHVQLETPASGGYVDITADEVVGIDDPAKANDRPYQARADVTTLIRTAGSGTYTVANLTAARGANRFAGWTLAVVYSNPSLPLRDINVFEGLVITVPGLPADVITASGLRTPVAGTVDAAIGLVAYEGDRASTGDKAALDKKLLGTAVSPANNYFNSTFDRFGEYVETGEPSYRNHLGFDVKVADAAQIIPNNATSAQVTLNTAGDYVFVGVVTTRIDLRAPRFPIIKSVTNLNNNDPAEVGDTLEYRLELTNVGDDPADATSITDPLPANTEFVPGSLAVDGSPMTDGSGDDAAEIDAGEVVARLGAGADAATGGRVGIGQSTVLTFRVTTLPGAGGTTVTNVATLRYRAVTLAQPAVASTNAVETAVRVPDLVPDPPGEPLLSIEKLATESVVAGGAIDYDITVLNEGTAPANLVTLDDPMPIGVLAVSVSPPCTIVAGDVSCALGTLAAGDRVTIHIEGTVADSTPGETTLTNTATVAAEGVAPISASADTRVPGTPNVTLVKSVVGTLVAGSTGTYRFTVSNEGSAAALDVVVTDTLPPGLTPLSGGPCDLDAETPTLLLCPIGDLAAGATETLDVRMHIAASSTGSLVNGALVTAAGIDLIPTDNTSVVTAPVTNPAGTTTTTTILTLPATGRTSSTPLTVAIVLLALGAALEAVRRRRPTGS